MEQATIDEVEAGDLCQCCGKFMPEGETETGHGLGSPVTCQRCKKNKFPVVDRTPDS